MFQNYGKQNLLSFKDLYRKSKKVYLGKIYTCINEMMSYLFNVFTCVVLCYTYVLKKLRFVYKNLCE